MTISRRSALKGAGRLSRARAQALAAINPYAAPTNTGPSSVTVPAFDMTPSVPGTPYIVPMTAGWTSTALLTTGNEVKGYRMAGIPDGLGAFDNGDRTSAKTRARAAATRRFGPATWRRVRSLHGKNSKLFNFSLEWLPGF